MSAREKWFARLRRCIKDMPPDTAVLVRHGCIELITPDARREAFARQGHLDGCEALATFKVADGKVEPAGESI